MRLPTQDRSIVRNLSSSFPEAALLCDALQRLDVPLEYGVRRTVVRKTFQLPMTRMSKLLHRSTCLKPLVTVSGLCASAVLRDILCCLREMGYATLDFFRRIGL